MIGSSIEQLAEKALQKSIVTGVKIVGICIVSVYLLGFVAIVFVIKEITKWLK